MPPPASACTTGGAFSLKAAGGLHSAPRSHHNYFTVCALYLNTYAPLVITRAGIEAARSTGLSPFVDGSIRREPDLEHAFPSITCLCRAGKFAPRLQVGDIVVYLTKKARYGGPHRHRRFTGVLRVCLIYDTHTDAAGWYRKRGFALPSNCMVTGNPAQAISRSHQGNVNRGCSASEFKCRWDAEYRERARRWGRFVICEPLWIDVGWTARRVDDADLVAVFGHVPGTRNPGRHPLTLLPPLLNRLKIRLRNRL